MNSVSVCQHCKMELDLGDIANEYSSLIDAMDNCTISEPTELQEAIYFGALCTECIPALRDSENNLEVERGLRCAIAEFDRLELEINDMRRRGIFPGDPICLT